MSLVSEIKASLSSPRAKRVLPYVGIVLLILIAVVAIYSIAVTPSRAPYRHALAKYQLVYKANVDFSAAGANMGASQATNEQFTKNVQKTRDALELLKNEAAGLGKQEVLTSGEGKILYDAFYEKLQAYTTYNADMLDSIEQARPVLFECQGLSNVSEDAASVAVLNDCAKKFKALDTLANDDYEQLIQRFQTLYTDLAKNIGQAAALKDPQGKDKARYTTYVEERTQLINDLGEAATTLTKNLRLHLAEVDITELSKALDDYLTKQSNIFSF